MNRILVTVFLLTQFSAVTVASNKDTSTKTLNGAIFTGVDKEIHYKEKLKIKDISNDVVTFDLNTEADYADIGEVCEGEIEDGKGKLVKNQIVFEGQEGCSIVMHLSKTRDRVSITDNNCNYYHGANCDFGGKNLKLNR